MEECYPEGFSWADPSKIRKSEVFRLLDHWRQREKDGLTPLIWNRSCELFDDGEICSRTIGIKKRKDIPSSSDSSTSSSPGPDFSQTDSEEDFRAELAKISSSDSNNPGSNSSSHSNRDPPSPSPLPRRSVSRVPEEIGIPTEGIPPFIPDPPSCSCELLSRLSISFQLYAAQQTKQEDWTPLLRPISVGRIRYHPTSVVSVYGSCQTRSICINRDLFDFRKNHQDHLAIVRSLPRRGHHPGEAMEALRFHPFAGPPLHCSGEACDLVN